jgi:hypothetical protein
VREEEHAMKAVVKWADMKRIGVPRRTWKQAIRRMEKVPGAKCLVPAAEAQRELKLPWEVFERMK